MTQQPTASGIRRRFPAPGQLARLWPRVRPYRGGLALATLALLLSAAIGLAFPQIVRYLLDAAFLRRDRALLDRIALLLLALFAVQAGLNFIQTYYLSATGERAVAGLRRELFDKLLTMPPGFFADRRTGELTSRLTTDIGLLQSVMSHQIAEFSRQALALIGGVVVLTYMLNRTRFGRHIYAVGGNAEAARRAGINVDNVKIACFGICSMMAALGGIVLASRLRSIDTNSGGGTILLYSIAAAVIGGTSLFGGRGHIKSAVLGALVIASIDNGLGLLGLSSGTKFVITGLVLLAAVAVDSFSRRGRAQAGRA